MAESVCPWWLGYLLASPIRRLLQNPESIVSPYVKTGMTVLEIGPGMGFFTLPMARIVGPKGKIICPDIQEKMLSSLKRRASRAGLSERVITKLSTSDSLNITEHVAQADFALAFAVVHEIPDQKKLFRQIYDCLKPGAKLLISEPTGHVTPEDFDKMLQLTIDTGFTEISRPVIKRGISAYLRKG
jgi:ubiquinone/menaquinone biosynthesis C-methylase UbiE